MKKHRIFVYGTLKRGYGNGVRLLDQAAEYGGHAEFVGEADLKAWSLRGGGIPFAHPDPKPGRWVRGEVWEIDDRTLERVDSLEGHPAAYCRVEVTVDLDDGGQVRAWVYRGPSDTVRASQAYAEWPPAWASVQWWSRRDG